MRRPAVGLTAARAPLPPVPALCGVDVGVRAGEVLAVVGTSGAGKSTLTALLAGVEAPTSGAVVAADWLAGGAGASPGRWTSRSWHGGSAGCRSRPSSRSSPARCARTC